MDRYQRGRNAYRKLIGSSPDESLAAVRARSPLMFDAVVEGGFGGTLSHADLSRYDRELATVAILAAIGDTAPQLAVHARAALRHGIVPAQLRALCEHVSGYAGFPRALNALSA